MAASGPSPSQTLDSKPAPTGGVAVASAEPAGPAERKPTHESVGSVIAAITANILVGIVKFIAAAISGSVAMVSEGIHSIVDSGNGFLVLLGIHKAKKPPTIEHPFGFGKELYFWTLVVAVSIFALGGGVSIMQGITAIQHALAGTTEHGNPLMSYIVLFAAMFIEGMSLRVAVKSFNKARGSKRPLEYIKDCKRSQPLHRGARGLRRRARPALCLLWSAAHAPHRQRRVRRRGLGRSLAFCSCACR